jgi:DNA-binding NarL/FixJ family response regulator
MMSPVQAAAGPRPVPVAGRATPPADSPSLLASAPDASRRIPVAIAGADPLTRAGLEAQLRDVVDLVPPGAAAPEGSVVLVVTDEADRAAAQLIRSAQAGTACRVVLLAGRIDDAGLLAAVEAGVSGVVRRSDASRSSLVGAIRAASADEGTLPSDLLGRLLSQVGRLQRRVLTPRGLTLGGLTEREVAVLRLLAEGHDTAEVGRRLYFSERTVKNVIHDITSRLELRNRAHAVAHAIREGLI